MLPREHAIGLTSTGVRVISCSRELSRDRMDISSNAEKASPLLASRAHMNGLVLTRAVSRSERYTHSYGEGCTLALLPPTPNGLMLARSISRLDVEPTLPLRRQHACFAPTNTALAYARASHLESSYVLTLPLRKRQAYFVLTHTVSAHARASHLEPIWILASSPRKQHACFTPTGTASARARACLIKLVSRYSTYKINTP